MKGITEAIRELKDIEESNSIKGIEKELLYSNRPGNWNLFEDGNTARKMEIDFRKYAISVGNKIGSDYKAMNVIDFYAAVELIEEQNG